MLRRKIPIAKDGDNSNNWQSTVWYHPGLKTFTNDQGLPLTVAIQYGNDPAQWTYTDDAGNTYTPHYEYNAGEIRQAKDPSISDRFLTASENNYNHPILGAPARYYYTVQNGTDPVTGAVSFMPGIGDVIDLASAGVTALGGNYGDAALQGAFSLLPFTNGNMANRMVSKAKNVWNKTKNNVLFRWDLPTSVPTIQTYDDYFNEYKKLDRKELQRLRSDYLINSNYDTSSAQYRALVDALDKSMIERSSGLSRLDVDERITAENAVKNEYNKLSNLAKKEGLDPIKKKFAQYTKKQGYDQNNPRYKAMYQILRENKLVDERDQLIERSKKVAKRKSTSKAKPTSTPAPSTSSGTTPTTPTTSTPTPASNPAPASNSAPTTGSTTPSTNATPTTGSTTPTPASNPTPSSATPTSTAPASSTTPTTGTSTTAPASPTPASSTANQAANQADKELQDEINFFQNQYRAYSNKDLIKEWKGFKSEEQSSTKYKAAQEDLKRRGYISKDGIFTTNKSEIRRNRKEYEKQHKAAEKQETPDRHNISDNPENVGRAKRFVGTWYGKGTIGLGILGGTYGLLHLGANGGGKAVGNAVGNVVNDAEATGEGISSGYNTARGNTESVEVPSNKEVRDSDYIEAPPAILPNPTRHQVFTLDDF